jgi:hypothetical protein
MSHATVTKHGKYDESEPLKCFCYYNRSIDFINSTFKRLHLTHFLIRFLYCTISPYPT